jgi:hypothetical protein
MNWLFVPEPNCCESCMDTMYCTLQYVPAFRAGTDGCRKSLGTGLHSRQQRQEPTLPQQKSKHPQKSKTLMRAWFSGTDDWTPPDVAAWTVLGPTHGGWRGANPAPLVSRPLKPTRR